MLDKQAVTDFFNAYAPRWDEEMIRSDEIIGILLENASVAENKEILDVACGTGVLFPDYLQRKVKSVTGIDIAGEMCAIASAKFDKEPSVTVLQGDAENFAFPGRYDVIMIYNAFPHFPDPEKLLRHLTEYLKPGGRLSVAHGMSRAAIDRHHHGAAEEVSLGLLEETELAGLMAACGLRAETVLSDDRMYQVVGVKEY